MISSYIRLIFLLYCSSGLAKDICKDQASNYQDLKDIVVACNKTVAELKVEKLRSSGFICNQNVEQISMRGHVCRGKITGYTENVRLYIPENLEDKGGVKYNFFFHGFRVADTFLEDSTGNAGGDYGAMLKKAQNNKSILIIPESFGKTVSYQQFSRKPNLLFEMINEIQKKSDIKMSQFTLSAHSGGYKVVNNLLSNKEIRSAVEKIALFDAVYSPIFNVQTWLQENPRNKLHLAWIYGPGESTRQETADFLKRTKNQSEQITQIKVYGKSTLDHMNMMQTGSLVNFINSP